MRLAQFVMGTLVEVTVRVQTVSGEEGEDRARDAAAEAMRECERIERVFSRYDADSELARVNREASHGPVSLSGEFLGLAARGMAYGKASGGAFSILLQPVIDLWKSCGAQGRVPSALELDTALDLCDERRVRLDPERGTIEFDRVGVQLNFDGLAKGYAADAMLALLRRRGIAAAMINVGTSSIGVISKWNLSLRHPGNRDMLAANFVLDRSAASTSTSGERGFVINGKWYSDVIDGCDGIPKSDLASATAVGESSELLEAASKILLLRGCRDGLRICDEAGWDVDALTLNQVDGGLQMLHPDCLKVSSESHV